LNYFVALLVELARDLGSNEASSADNDNLYDFPCHCRTWNLLPVAPA
jgi:hypothetical protein